MFDSLYSVKCYMCNMQHKDRCKKQLASCSLSGDIFNWPTGRCAETYFIVYKTFPVYLQTRLLRPRKRTPRRQNKANGDRIYVAKQSKEGRYFTFIASDFKT